MIASFVYFGHQADLAMSKDGVGDLAQFNSFNQNAGISFYAASILWGLAVIVSLVKRRFRSKEAQLAIGLPPIALMFGVLIPWFI